MPVLGPVRRLRRCSVLGRRGYEADHGDGRIGCCAEFFLIDRPERITVAAKLLQPVPAVEAGVVAIGEADFHGVIAHRGNAGDGHVLLVARQGAAFTTMALHFRRGRMHTQEFSAELKAFRVIGNDEDAGVFLIAEFGGGGGEHWGFVQCWGIGWG